jgi:phage-related minor tail protein
VIIIADRIKGIKIEIGGETTGLEKALSEVNKKGRALTSELKDIDRLLKFDPTNTELLAQRQKVLGEQVENTSNKLEQLRAAQEQVDKQFEEGKLTGEQYRAFQREIQQTEGILRNYENRIQRLQTEEEQLAQETAEAAKKLTRFKNAVEEAGKAVKETGEKAQEAGENISGFGEGLTGISAGIGVLGGGAIAAASNIEDSFAMIQASLGVTEEKASELQGVAENLWKRGFGESLDEAASSVSHLYSMLGDVPLSELEAASEGVLTLSKVFGTDLVENATALNTTMVNFKVDSTTALDLITTAAQKTGGVFRDDLADALTELAPTLTGMGAEGAEAFKLLITASQSGMENFDALSSLTQTFADGMIGGSEDVAEAFAAMGTEGEKMWADFQSGNLSAYDAMIQATGALKGIEDENKRNQVGAALFGDVWTEASADAIMSLNNAKGGLEGFQGAAANAGDIIEQTFSQRMKGSLAEVGKALEPLGGVLMDFVDRILPPLVAMIGSLATWFQGLSDPMQNAIIIFGAIAAIIPILLVALGGLIASIGSIIIGFSFLAPVIGAIGTAIAFLVSPIGLAILAFVALIAIGVAVAKNWTMIKERAIKDFTELVNGVKKLGRMIADAFNRDIQELKDIWNGIAKFFKSIDLSEIGRNIIGGLIKGITGKAQELYNKASEIANNIGKKIGKALKVGSPSKVTMELGEFAGEGLVVGLANTIGSIRDMSSKMAAATIPNIETASAPIQTMNNQKSMIVNITSPKALDVREANKEFNRTINRMSTYW